MAEFKGVDPLAFVETLNCESGFNPLAVGDSGTSFGIAQFHNPTEWGITESQALNPWLSIALAADSWSRGESSRWSCYRLLYPDRN